MSGLDTLVPTPTAARLVGVSQATVRAWAARGHLAVASRTPGGRPLYRAGDVFETERETRSRDDTGRAIASRRVERMAGPGPRRRSRPSYHDLIVEGQGGPEDECWIWPGTINASGYGVLWVDGRTQRAHRVSYQIHRYNGAPLPTDRELNHMCPTRSCWNPNHLELVPHAQNCQARTRGVGSSRFVGVGRDKASGKWRVQLRGRGWFYNRYFADEVDAAIAALEIRDSLGIKVHDSARVAVVEALAAREGSLPREVTSCHSMDQVHPPIFRDAVDFRVPGSGDLG